MQIWLISPSHETVKVLDGKEYGEYGIIQYRSRYYVFGHIIHGEGAVAYVEATCALVV